MGGESRTSVLFVNCKQQQGPERYQYCNTAVKKKKKKKSSSATSFDLEPKHFAHFSLPLPLTPPLSLLPPVQVLRQQQLLRLGVQRVRLLAASGGQAGARQLL